MLEAIKALSRDTIARENGLETSSAAMNNFCALMMQNRKQCSTESLLNRLEWITTYPELDENLKKMSDTKIRKIEAYLSQSREIDENHKVR